MDLAQSKDQEHRHPDKSNKDNREETKENANLSQQTSKNDTPRQTLLAERTTSQLEERHSWPRMVRQTIVTAKNRCQTTHEVRFAENLHGLYSARFSKTGEVIATGFGCGTIQLRHGATGELKATLKSALKTSMPVMCCRFNPVHQDIFYASSACGTIYMYNMYTREFSKFIFESKNEVNTIDVSINGDYMVSGGKDATVRLYDVHTTKLISEYKRKEEDIETKAIKFHRMRIFASRFHQDYPDLIITGGWDDTVRVWDIRNPTGSVRIIKGPHICGDAIDIRETQILTGSWVVRDSLQIWDLMSAKLIESICPQNRLSTLNGEFLYVVQYFDGDPYGDLILVGGSGIGAVELISIKEKKVLGSFSVNKPIFIIDSHQTTIMFGGMESIITLGNYS